MSIDLKSVELTADVLEIFLENNPQQEHPPPKVKIPTLTTIVNKK